MTLIELEDQWNDNNIGLSITIRYVHEITLLNEYNNFKQVD